MKEFIFTKTLGIIVGALTIVLAIGFGLLSFIGMSLGNALNSSTADAAPHILPIVLSLLLSGIITAMGSFWVKGRRGRVFYSGFSFVMGIALVIVFFLSLGALGTEEEIFILCVGIIYLLLGFLAKKRL
jgi:membrane protease YdiL (CAAX protease family)